MMRKDFARYTDMSIDDMVSTLKNLEDSLLNRRPVMEFLEPLRKLAAYQKKTQDQSKHGAQLVGNGHSRLTEAELLVNVIVNDAQRMLLDTITARDTEYGQMRTDVDDNTSSFPVLEYYEESRPSPAPCTPLTQSPTVSFSCVWSDEALPRMKYLVTV